MSLHIAYISVGSNIGDRLSNCCQGIESLCAEGQVTLLARSPLYETEPVDYMEQDWFLNAAIKVQTELAPPNLLLKMQAVQHSAGRKAGGVRFGPRTLDLDIILYDDVVMSTPELTIPHKRMHKRRFVLQPICDIDPDIMHPLLRQTVKSLLDQLDDEGQGIRPCSYDC